METSRPYQIGAMKTNERRWYCPKCHGLLLSTHCPPNVERCRKCGRMYNSDKLDAKLNGEQKSAVLP